MIRIAAKLMLCLVAAASLLPGCAQMEVRALANKCDFSTDPRFADLRGKVPLSPTEVSAPPSLSEISNNNRPTPSERESLIAFSDASQFCRTGAMNIADRYGTPEIAGALREYSLANLNVRKLLVDGQFLTGRPGKLVTS